MLSVPFRKIVCEFGRVGSGPFRGIVDPQYRREEKLASYYDTYGIAGYAGLVAN